LRPKALALFGVTTGKAPCDAAHHYVLQSLDADASARVPGACGRRGPGGIAVDREMLKSSCRLEGNAIHLLSVFSTDIEGLPGDLAVAPCKTEICYSASSWIRVARQSG
jgi:hypothetical protein